MAKRTLRARRPKLAPEPAFDVALSFAGKDRDYVERTAAVLKQMGLRVFYDKYEQVSLWGKNLYDHLSQIYGMTARYTVMFISKYYARNLWTNLERQSAQAKAFSERSEYILPVRFDDTDIPGIHATLGYIDLKNIAPEKLAELIKAKIGPLVRENFMPDDPDRIFPFFGATTVAEQRLLTHVARSVFEDLSLMTPVERRLVRLLSINTCPAGPECDGDVHLNIERLARLSGVSRRQILEICSRIECLNFSHRLTSHDKGSHPKNILRLTYDLHSVDEGINGRWTPVVYSIFRCIDENLCPDCRFSAVDRMDFSVLSTLTGLPDAHVQSKAAANSSIDKRRIIARKKSSARTIKGKAQTEDRRQAHSKRPHD